MAHRSQDPELITNSDFAETPEINSLVHRCHLASDYLHGGAPLRRSTSIDLPSSDRDPAKSRTSRLGHIKPDLALAIGETSCQAIDLVSLARFDGRAIRTALLPCAPTAPCLWRIIGCWENPARRRLSRCTLVCTEAFPEPSAPAPGP